MSQLMNKTSLILSPQVDELRQAIEEADLLPAGEDEANEEGTTKRLREHCVNAASFDVRRVFHVLLSRSFTLRLNRHCLQSAVYDVVHDVFDQHNFDWPFTSATPTHGYLQIFLFRQQLRKMLPSVQNVI